MKRTRSYHQSLLNYYCCALTLLAAGLPHLGISATRLVVWGWTADGQANLPYPFVQTNADAEIPDIKAVAAGRRHVVALTANGTVVNWGDNGFGQLNCPPGLSNVTAISAATYNTLALKDDGTMVGWGWNIYGICDIPEGLANVAAISAGVNRSLALQADGTLVSWGFDNGLPSGLSGITGMGGQILALKADGTVIQWGLNSGDTTNTTVGPPATLADAAALAVGQGHYLGLNVDGTVVAWGYNYYGQLNVPPGLSNVVAIAAGEVHSLALKSDGTVVAWGDNSAGECDVPPGLSNVIAIAGGGWTSVAVVGDGPPAITLQPFSQRAIAGARVQLHARAAGVPPLTYQWQKGGTKLPGATQATLFLTNVSRPDSGTYTAAIFSPAGNAVTSPANLVVRSPQRLNPGALLPDGSFALTSIDQDGTLLSAEDLNRFEAQASSDLKHWITLPAVLAVTNGALLLHDITSAPSAVRFYRIVEH